MLTNENSTERGCRTSGIQLAQKCPFACQKIYRDKVQGQKNEAAIFGSMLHNMLEDYGGHCLEKKFDTDYDYFDSIIEKHLATVPAHLHPGGRSIGYALKDRCNFTEDNQADFAAVETRFMLDENLEITTDPKEKYFSGGLDKYFIIGTRAFATDYKSYRKISTMSELESNLQKDYYPYLLFMAFPEVEDIEFTFDFIRYGYTSKPFIFNRTEHLAMLRKSLRAGVEYFYALMNTEETLEARPSGFCCLCEVPGICPAVNNALVIEARINSQEDAVNAARQLKAAENKLTILKKVLSEYTAEYGPIPISNIEEYGRTVETGYEVEDMYGLVKALLAIGVKKGPLFDEIKISQKSVSKLLLRYNIHDFDMSKYSREKKTTKLMYKNRTFDESEGENESGNT